MTSRLNPEAQAALDAVRAAIFPPGMSASSNPTDNFSAYKHTYEGAVALEAVLAALENLDARLKALEDRCKRKRKHI